MASLRTYNVITVSRWCLRLQFCLVLSSEWVNELYAKLFVYVFNWGLRDEHVVETRSSNAAIFVATTEHATRSSIVAS